MQLKSTEIQNRLNELDGLIQGEASDVQKTIWENERNGLRDQLQIALTNEQAHEGRIQEATAESENILDDIEIAGVPIAESGLSELAYKILKAKVQAKFVAKVEALSNVLNEQQTESQQEIKAVTERAVQAEIMVSQLQVENKDLEVANYQLGLDNESLGIKVTKGAEMLGEATETIEEQKAIIEDYKKKELQGYSAPQKVVLTTNEQVAQQEAQLRASQIPVTYMKADPNDFTSKIWNIITVIPEESRNIHYFEKGLYRLVDEVEAEQLRADEANKKAAEEAIQAAIPTINPTAIPFVNEDTRQDEATTDKAPNETDQVDATEPRLVDSQSTEDGTDAEKESEVITLSSFGTTPVTKTELGRRLSDFRNELLNELELNYGLVRNEVA